MKIFLSSILVALSTLSFSQTEDVTLIPHVIVHKQVTLTLYLTPQQSYVESDSGHVVYGNNFIMKVEVADLGDHKLFVSGAACKITLKSKEESTYTFSTTTHVGKRKISVNYGGMPEIFEFWIHPA